MLERHESRTGVPPSAAAAAVFGDDVVVAAMIDRRVNHADVVG